MARPRPNLFRTGPLATSRVEAFSDGVLAVVITLLVLEVKVPSDLKSDLALWRAIWGIAPVLLAWVVSFAFVLTFWVSHHYFFAALRRTDRGLLWLNGLFLLSVTLIPFPTGLVGTYPGYAAPLALLSGAMCLTSLSFLLMRLYATRHAGLLRDEIPKAQQRFALVQSAAAPALYALAIGLSLIWPPGAILIQIGVLLLFFLRTPSHAPTDSVERPAAETSRR